MATSEYGGDQLHLTLHLRSGRVSGFSGDWNWAGLEQAHHIPRPKSGMTRLARV